MFYKQTRLWVSLCAIFFALAPTWAKAKVTTYTRMSENHYIDFCHGLSPCGKGSADSICIWKGYKKSIAFKKSRNLKRTYYLRNRKFCDDNKVGPFKTCNGLEYIRCVK